jgi:hypothetical protein
MPSRKITVGDIARTSEDKTMEVLTNAKQKDYCG